jgi:hypothetical protein
MVAIRTGTDGNLYYLSRGDSSLYKIVYDSQEPPLVTQQPDANEVSHGDAAVFSVYVSGAQPMQFQWKKDGHPIDGETNYQLTIGHSTGEDVGRYSVDVTNAYGQITTNEVLLRIKDLNVAPRPVIRLPDETLMYRGGQIISFSGDAFDSEDGQLPASSLLWQIDFHHREHVHSIATTDGSSSGEFEIPVTGEVSDTVWYRLSLSAEDSEGQLATVYRDIFPRKSNLILQTAPAGLELKLDERLVLSPHEFVSVQGVQRKIDIASSQQVFDGRLYQFRYWQHGGDTAQFIITPDTDATFTAMFEEITFAPAITVQPHGQTLTMGSTAALEVFAMGSFPLHYQWKKNDTDILHATGSILKLVDIDQNAIGRYRVEVTNGFGSIVSDEVVIRLEDLNFAPQAEIVSPGSGVMFRAGERITFSGKATGFRSNVQGRGANNFFR